jgi:hypothetical protein
MKEIGQTTELQSKCSKLYERMERTPELTVADFDFINADCGFIPRDADLLQTIQHVNNEKRYEIYCKKLAKLMVIIN